MRFWLAILLTLIAAPALAQQSQGMSQALVVSSCGTQTLPAGPVTNLTMDTTGRLCQSGIGSNICAEATAFLGRTTGLSGTEATAYATLICGMVTDGTFSLLDGLYIFATNSATTANLNLVSTSYTLTKFGTVTFAADVGYTGNGTTGYFDSGFNATSPSPHYTQNSASVGGYVTNSRTAGNTSCEFGISSSSYTFWQPLNATGTYEINGSTFPTYTPANARGSWLLNRVSSSAISLWKNEASVATSSADTSGVVSTTSNMFFLAYSSNTNVASAGSYSSDTMAAGWFGAGLTNPQIVAVQSRINAYMTALGINVY